MAYYPHPSHHLCSMLPPLAKQSARPELTRLVLLAAADPRLAEQLLRDETLDLADVHPHYTLALDEHDRATLAQVRAHSDSVSAFLAELADAADGELTIS